MGICRERNFGRENRETTEAFSRKLVEVGLGLWREGRGLFCCFQPGMDFGGKGKSERERERRTETGGEVRQRVSRM